MSITVQAQDHTWSVQPMADSQPLSTSLGVDAAMAEASQPTMQIHIKTMAQSTHHVRISPTALVSDLKALISDTIPESPVAQQRIIYRGRALADSQVKGVGCAVP